MITKGKGFGGTSEAEGQRGTGEAWHGRVVDPSTIVLHREAETRFLLTPGRRPEVSYLEKLRGSKEKIPCTN